MLVKGEIVLISHVFDILNPLLITDLGLDWLKTSFKRLRGETLNPILIADLVVCIHLVYKTKYCVSS